MKEVLFLCNTYFQLIVSMQIRLTMFADDKCYLILTNHSKNTEEVVKRVKETGCFDAVFHAEVKSLDQDKHGTLEAMSAILSGVTGRAKWMGAIWQLKCDEFIYYNLSVSTVQIFAMLSKKNRNLICSRMEEGIPTYNNNYHDALGGKLSKRLRLIFGVRALLLRKNITEKTLCFYCFYPDIYKGKLTPKSIPKIDRNSSVVEILKASFDLKIAKLIYTEKYIFFTGVHDFEGGSPIGEYDIVCKIAKLIGRDNLLIKIHPRDRRTIYEDEGFNVDTNSSIPWEVIQLSFDFDDKVYLTATSGSVLAGSLMARNPINTFFMYQCCNIAGNPSAIKASEDIKMLLDNPDMREKLKMVRIAENVEDILKA